MGDDFFIKIESRLTSDESKTITAQPVPNLDTIVGSLLIQSPETRSNMSSTEIVLSYFHQILEEIDKYPDDLLYLVDKNRLGKYVTRAGKALSLLSLSRRSEHHKLKNLFSLKPVSKNYGIEWIVLPNKEQLELISHRIEKEPVKKKENIELNKLYETKITQENLHKYYDLRTEDWKVVHYVCAVLRHLSENLKEDRSVDRSRLKQKVAEIAGVTKQAASRAITLFIKESKFDYETNRGEDWIKLGDTKTIDTIFQKSEPKIIRKKRFSGNNERLNQLYQSGIGIEIVQNNLPDSTEELSVIHYIYGVLKHLDKNLYEDNRYVDVNSLRDLIASYSDEISSRKATLWVNKFLKATKAKPKKSKGNEWYNLYETDILDSVFEELKPKPKIKKQSEKLHENKKLQVIYKELKNEGLQTIITSLNPELYSKSRTGCEPLHYIQAALTYISTQLPEENKLFDRDGLAGLITYLRPDFGEKKVKSAITRAMNKIGYESKKIAGEIWFELGDPKSLANIVEKTKKKKTRLTRKKDNIEYIVGGAEVDKLLNDLSGIEDLPNNFNVTSSKLGVGEHLYNLFAYMRSKLGEEILIEKDQIVKYICENTGISSYNIGIIFWRFTQGAKLLYEEKKDIYMLGEEGNWNKGYKTLKNMWPSSVPNELLEN